MRALSGPGRGAGWVRGWTGARLAGVRHRGLERFRLPAARDRREGPLLSRRRRAAPGGTSAEDLQAPGRLGAGPERSLFPGAEGSGLRAGHLRSDPGPQARPGRSEPSAPPALGALRGPVPTRQVGRRRRGSHAPCRTCARVSSRTKVAPEERGAPPCAASQPRGTAAGPGPAFWVDPSPSPEPRPAPEPARGGDRRGPAGRRPRSPRRGAERLGAAAETARADRTRQHPRSGQPGPRDRGRQRPQDRGRPRPHDRNHDRPMIGSPETPRSGSPQPLDRGHERPQDGASQ
ncbi:protein FAM246C-like [Perognathus longimembris pacificus]|uniref:protein FAM246C-like n=1 Tax=Perognathus longimembris pacificus TaxID=214514 RepID=UPI002019D964|nr:protein FAM246C-like [Perognathus longimembris pacificus]